MSDTVGRAVLEIVIDDKQYKFALDQIDKRTDETADHIKGIGQNLDFHLLKEFAHGAMEALKVVVEQVIELGERGSEVHDVERAFSALTGRVHETAEGMLGPLREGVKGTISDFELMKMANVALGSGIIKSASDMAVLSTGARALGKATGVDTKEAFDTLTSAIATGRTAHLKQIGLFVDSKVAAEQYAQTLGKAEGDLSQYEKSQALAGATLDALRARFKLIKPDAADFGEMIKAGIAQLHNFRDALSVAVAEAPVLKIGMLALGKAVQDAFGPDRKTLIQDVVGIISELIIFGIKATRVFLDFAQFTVQAFNGLKVVFNAVFEGLFDLSAKLTGALAGMAEKAALLPGILGGPEFKKIGEVLRADATEAANLSKGFADNKEAALSAAQAVQTGFGKADEVLRKVQVAMEANRHATHEAAEEVKRAAPDIAGDTTVPRTLENSRKIQAAYRELQEAIDTTGRVGIDLRLKQLENAQAKEIAGLRELKGLSAKEYEELRALVVEKYKGMADGARAGADEIRDRTTQLQREIAGLQTHGIQARMVELDAARQKEIQGLANLKQRYVGEYTDLVNLVNQKYDALKAKAQEVHISITRFGSVSNDQQRMQATRTLNEAKANYEAMLQSGSATYAELTEARKKYHDAEEALGKLQVKGSMERGMMMAQAASTILTSIFGKSKAAAIAAATIDTAAAVVTSFKNGGGYPWGLIPAAAMLAAGIKQITTIKNQNFKVGTPNLDFMNFGRETPAMLHEDEAVIPKGGGHVLAGEIATSMRGKGDGDQTAEKLDKLIALFERQPAAMARAWKNAQALA